VSDISESYYRESYVVFEKYQMSVHSESASDCTESDFDNFLVNSPLRGTSVCCIYSLNIIKNIH